MKSILRRCPNISSDGNHWASINPVPNSFTCTEIGMKWPKVYKIVLVATLKTGTALTQSNGSL